MSTTKPIHMPRQIIKLVTLDLDDTLWPNKKVIIESEKALWRFVNLKFPEIERKINEEKITAIKVNLVETDPLIKFDLTRFRKEVIKEILLHLGAQENEAIYYSNEAFSEFFKIRNKVKLFPGAKNILERLNRDTNLISLSNGNADLGIIGIANFFKATISSQDVSSNKPAPQHFLKALKIGGCEPEESLHIGDCPINDIGGARNCNFHTIWFNCEKRKWDEIVPYEYQAKSWKDVYDVINKNFILEKINV